MSGGFDWESQFSGLLNHSMQAGILVLFVLAAQGAFRRRLASRWRFALWWVVIARLLLPFSPRSTASLFNVFRPTIVLDESRADERPAPPIFPGPNVPVSPGLPLIAPNEEHGLEVKPLPKSLARTGIQTAKPVQIPPENRVAAGPRPWRLAGSWVRALAGAWVAGALSITAVVAVQLFGFYRSLASAAAPCDPVVQMLLDDTRREFGLSRRIELLETGAVQSPALFGLVRPRLLLPRGMADKFGRRELRYVFLHELAHIKRGDLWLNWLLTGLQIAHWFNPLVWLGFARLRTDREMACDELALLRAGDKSGTAYGETVIKMLEFLDGSTVAPGLVGLLEDKRQMRRRVWMIAKFRRRGRASPTALLVGGAVALVALTDAPPGKSSEQGKFEAVAADPSARDSRISDPEILASDKTAQLDLAGRVFAKGGAPLPVPATVIIDHASSMIGAGLFCPDKYLDWRTRVTTHADGVFKIVSLDSRFSYRILAVAKGYQPKYLSGLNSLGRGPLMIEMEPVKFGELAWDRSVRGRVVNENGAPIAGAFVKMEGVEWSPGRANRGAVPGVDPLAVTDDQGEFFLASKAPFVSMELKVAAGAYSLKRFDGLASGFFRHDLVMGKGAALTGRVLNKGEPLPGVSICVIDQDMNYWDHFETRTDPQGRFAFANLPPDRIFRLYSLMSSMTNGGALPLLQIRSGKDGETTAAGDMAVGRANRLAGRVVLADGRPLPRESRLSAARQGVCDSIEVKPGPDGTFDVAGLPDDTYSLYIPVPGYYVSVENEGFNPRRCQNLDGRVNHDITNLVILMERGSQPRPDYKRFEPDYPKAGDGALRGAEGWLNRSR